MSKKSRRQRRRERRAQMRQAETSTWEWKRKYSYHHGDDMYFGEIPQSYEPLEGEVVTIIDHAHNRDLRKVVVEKRIFRTIFAVTPLTERSMQE